MSQDIDPWLEGELDRMLEDADRKFREFARKKARMSTETTVVPIDDGVPVPAVTDRPTPRKWPLADLGVGQSFFAPEAKIKSMSRLASTVRWATGSRFTCKTTIENGTLGVRVWRVS